jgi:hypothetical protein
MALADRGGSTPLEPMPPACRPIRKTARRKPVERGACPLVPGVIRRKKTHQRAPLAALRGFEFISGTSARLKGDDYLVTPG